MMMSQAIPSEREEVSFSLRGDRDIDDRKLPICQLREGVLSEWLDTYLETIKVDSLGYFFTIILCQHFALLCLSILPIIVSSKGFEHNAGLLTDVIKTKAKFKKV